MALALWNDALQRIQVAVRTGGSLAYHVAPNFARPAQCTGPTGAPFDPSINGSRLLHTEMTSWMSVIYNKDRYVRVADGAGFNEVDGQGPKVVVHLK